MWITMGISTESGGKLYGYLCSNLEATEDRGFDLCAIFRSSLFTLLKYF